MYQFINQLSFNLVVIETQQDKTCIRRVNSAALKLLAYEEAELIGKPLAMLCAVEHWQATLETVHDPHTRKSFEAELICKDQHKINALVSFSVLAHTANTIVLLIQTVNERRQRDKDLFVMHRSVEQSASAVLITDQKGRIEYVNPKFTELTGYSADELIGQNPKILQSGETPAEDYQAIWSTLLSTGEWHGEIKNQKKSGETYWAYECVSAVKNDQGEITHFLAIEEDISLQKAAEAALTDSEERFRQMAEMAGEWLWEQDPKGYYSYSSNAVKQILGFSPEEVIGKHYTEFLAAQDKIDQQLYADSRQPFYALTSHYRHKDGHLVLTESTGLPIINEQGRLIKWRGVDRDITARKHFQDALIESEKRMRLIIESSINAIVLMDSYGIVMEWNGPAERIFGWQQHEAIGQRLEDLIIPPQYRTAHRQGLQNFLKTGQGPILHQLMEHTAIRKDGTEFPVEISISPLKLGNTYIFSGFIHDISGRKAKEQQIREAEIKLALAQGEINIAQRIQASLSPSVSIKTEQLEITGFCLPATQVGGDYFDYFYRNDQQLDMVIADVSGHSLGPALFMVETRSALRTQANETAGPAKTLCMLNRFLFSDLNKSDFFITLFYLQYDIEQGLATFANAGHPPPLLLSRFQNTCRELDAEGLILGINEQVNFEERSLKLYQGDLILFYTDGITEAENSEGEFFGLERLKEALIKHSELEPQAIIETLLTELKAFCQTEKFNDDITLMIFRRG